MALMLGLVTPSITASAVPTESAAPTSSISAGADPAPSATPTSEIVASTPSTTTNPTPEASSSPEAGESPTPTPSPDPTVDASPSTSPSAGNVTLTGGAFTTSEFTGTGSTPIINCPIVALAPGETVVCTATYVVTAGDIAAGRPVRLDLRVVALTPSGSETAAIASATFTPASEAQPVPDKPTKLPSTGVGGSGLLLVPGALGVLAVGYGRRRRALSRVR